MKRSRHREKAHAFQLEGKSNAPLKPHPNAAAGMSVLTLSQTSEWLIFLRVQR